MIGSADDERKSKQLPRKEVSFCANSSTWTLFEFALICLGELCLANLMSDADVTVTGFYIVL